MNDLVIQKLGNANRALAEAKTIQQTKTVVDVAHAAEIYARRQKLGEDAINYAYSIKIEALAKLGKMLKEQPPYKGGRLKSKYKLAGHRVPPATERGPLLKELGLTKDESALAQKLASLSEATFKAVKDGTESVSRAIKRIEKASNKPKRPIGQPAEGMQYARMAIMQLQEIKQNDTERSQAFDFVAKWITENRGDDNANSGA